MAGVVRRGRGSGHAQYRLPAAETRIGLAAGSPLVADAMGQYVRWLTLVAGLMFVLMSLRPGQKTCRGPNTSARS